MRLASLTLPLLLLATGACSLFSSDEQTDYAKPNSLMADEIHNRVQQIPFQHRDELLQNLLWLAQTGETTIPSLLQGLKSENAKVRSSCAWVLGRIRDRRAIPQLQQLANDKNETVRLEIARTLVGLGDMKPAPTLIEGLDSEKKEVRYLCHEALKAATGRDFGFDHLSDNQSQRRQAVLGWRQWWSEYSGDTFFAASYQQRYNLNQAAQPMGETQTQPQNNGLYTDPMHQPMPQDPQPQPQQPQQQDQSQNPNPNPDQPQDQPITPVPHDGDEPQKPQGDGSKDG